MVVYAPRENSDQVEKAYQEIMALLKEKYMIQATDFNKMQEDRDERNATFKEALRKLFELDAWEGW